MPVNIPQIAHVNVYADVVKVFNKREPGRKRRIKSVREAFKRHTYNVRGVSIQSFVDGKENIEVIEKLTHREVDTLWVVSLRASRVR